MSGLAGPLRYEWVRITTVKSTWALIALGALVPAGLALFVTWIIIETSISGIASQTIHWIGRFITTPSLVLITIVSIRCPGFKLIRLFHIKIFLYCHSIHLLVGLVLRT